MMMSKKIKKDYVKCKGWKDADDELCDCGHLRSEHNDFTPFAKGKGSCKRCKCQKFLWIEFVRKKRFEPCRQNSKT